MTSKPEEARKATAGTDRASNKTNLQVLGTSLQEAVNNGEAKTVPAQVEPSTGEAPTTVRERAAEGIIVVRQRLGQASGVVSTRAQDIYCSGNELVAKPSFKVTAVGALVGGTALGAGGATTGFVAGGALGACGGLLVAPLTFGLSIPVGAFLGSGTGLAVCGAAGGTVGLVGGGATAYGMFQKRENIHALCEVTKRKVGEGDAIVRRAAAAMCTRTAETIDSARHHTSVVIKKAVVKAKDLGATTGEVVSSKSFQATAAGAAAGTVSLAAGGAVAGTTAGGFLGASVGLLCAPLTFGLSIPFGAVVGSGAGLAVGTTVGGATGFVCGSASGYGLYQKSDDIRSGAACVQRKVGEGVVLARDRAENSARVIRDAVSGAKGRLGGQAA